MTENLVQAGCRHVQDVQTINRELIEKSLRMRCLGYLHQVKSELLTLTIFSLSESKKEMQRLTRHLSLRADTLERQRETIAHQRDELARRNRELEEMRNGLEERVQQRTRALQERIRQEAKIQQALRESEARFREYAKVFQTTAEGLMITDAHARILEVNPALTRLTGLDPGQVIGMHAGELHAAPADPALFEQIAQTLRVRNEWQGEVRVRRGDDGSFPAWLTITCVADERNRGNRYVGVFADITRIKESEAQLDHLAHHDPLTGLPNRLLFHARLEHALSRARREGTDVALLFLDLDRFKAVNDGFGHPVGDALLQAVGRRLSACVRDEDTVARLSGDEFTVILEDVTDATGPGLVAEKLLETLQQPFRLSGHELFVSTSIGISLYPEDGNDVTTLVRNADVAMYRAKERGRDRYRFYTEEMTAHTIERLSLETGLRHALERNQIRLQYQPQFELASGRPVCLEGLVRWRHPELGNIPPEKFIPVAEESGLIEPLGNWLIRRACSDLAAWRDAGIPPCRIALNLSVRQLDLGNITHTVEEALSTHGLNPRWLELELTETGLMSRPEHHIRALRNLRAMGIGLAIDDFGTGYSSLAYLKRFPLDRLKIDHGFVRGVPNDANDVAIVRAVLAMSRSLGLTVVAEGVETEEQRGFLLEAGCQQAQGFLLCEPLEVDACRVMLERYHGKSGAATPIGLRDETLSSPE